MPQPVLGSFAQGLYDAIAPLAYDDKNNGWALALYCNAIGEMFQEIEDYARDSVDANGRVIPGWSSIVDVNRAPSAGLAWLAQLVGVTLDQRLSDADQRAQIRNVGGWDRGSLASIAGAPLPYLTGTKTVIIRERDPGACAAQPAYGLTVITKTSETPNSAAVLAALLAQKPAGLVLNYVVLAGNDYTLVYNGGATTYANIFSTYTTYQGLLNGVPGT